MKFKATLRVHTTGDIVQRNPGFWDKVKKAFGANPNLDTDRMKTKMQAADLVMGVKRALERLGVDNAVALVVDGQVLFEDKHGKDGDASDLFTSFFENEDVYGREFNDLRLAVEHRAAGLHYIIEVIATGEHVKSQATALVHIGGRVVDLEPKVGEDADAFRARVTPLLSTPALAETSRLQFESFAARVDEAMRAAMSGVTIKSDEAKSLVERPGQAARGRGRGQAGPPGPNDPRYDPYDRYHPNPMGDLMTMMFWTSMMSWAWHPHYVVIDQTGNEVGSTEDLDAASGDGTSDGGGMDDGDGGDAGGADDGGDFDAGGDGGDFDFGGDW